MGSSLDSGEGREDRDKIESVQGLEMAGGFDGGIGRRES